MTRARDVANLIGSGNFSSTTFTATAGQTAFTISHTQGFIQVFMNGLLLDETVDYTSNGSAVTLTSGAAAGDEIEVVAYNTFSVGDALNQAAADTRYVNTSGDTMTGALTVTGNVGIDTGTITPRDVGASTLQIGGNGTRSAIKMHTSSSGIGATDGLFLGYDTSPDFNILNGEANGAIKLGTSSTNRMTINHNGYVTMPNQPAWVVYANSRTGWQTTGIQKTPYDTVIHAEPSSAYSTTNWRYTAPATGRYWVQISQNGISDIILYIYKNGSFYHGGEFRSNPTGSWEHYTIGTVVQLSANDYVEAYVNLGNSGGYAWNGGASHWDQFSGFLIG